LKKISKRLNYEVGLEHSLKKLIIKYTISNKFIKELSMNRFILSCLFILLSATFACASGTVGEISRFEGDVRVYSQGSLKGVQVREKGHELVVRDIVKTKRKALADVLFADGSRAILKERSTLEIEGIQGLNVQNGRVLFNIKKGGRLKGTIVKAKSVVIGIKGTRFLVDDSSGKLKLFLKEGTLSIQAREGEFVKYSKSEKEQFESYKSDELGGFDKYRKKMTSEFKEFVKEFEMSAGAAISIDGKEVRDIGIPPEIEEEFRLLDES